MPSRLNLAGHRWSHFMVLDQREVRGRYAFWLCRCDCGAEKWVRVEHIRRGQPKSCGCKWDRRKPRLPLEDRFMRHVEMSETGCWLWKSHIHPKGYGAFGVNRKAQKAHRVSWQLFRGPLTMGLVIDHLCRVRSCVNPDHLREITAVENTMIGSSPQAINARKTHCPRGHPYDAKNTMRFPSMRGRVCRECKRVWSAKSGKARTLKKQERRCE